MYSKYELMKKARLENPIQNASGIKDTAGYMLVILSKFDLMLEAMKLNPYQSSHFGWVDFGIRHVPEDMGQTLKEFDFDKSCNAFDINCNRVRICCGCYIKNDEAYNQRYITGSLAMGYITANLENMTKFCHLVIDRRDELLIQNICISEEQIMPYIYHKNKDLFSIYYGAYWAIFSNYIHARNAIDHIINYVMLEAYRQKDWAELCHVCEYLYESHRAGHAVMSCAEIHTLLDNYFIGAYYYEPASGKTWKIRDYYRSLLKFKEFNEIYQKHKDRIEANFAFLH
jgi:hypothetical protein